MSSKKAEDVGGVLRAQWQAMQDWRRKSQRMREIVFGDYSALYDSSASDEKVTHAPELLAINDDERDTRTLMIKSVKQGSTNNMLRSLKTLVMQTAYAAPEMAIRGVGSEMASLHSLYLSTRLGPRPLGCDAVEQMRLCLWDMLITGVGFAGISLNRGRPELQHYDPLKVMWDPSGSTIHNARWISVRDTDRLSSWVALYPDSGALKKLKESYKDSDPIVALDFYYEALADDPDGFHAVYISNNDSVGEPVIFGANPFVFQTKFERFPFLPIESLHLWEIPGHLTPVPTSLMMLPHQLAIMASERQQQEILATQPAMRIYNRSALDSDQLRDIKDNQHPKAIVLENVNDLAQAVMDIPAGQPSEAVAQLKAEHEQALIAMAGENPYATGSAVEGVQFATEAGAIQSQAGLTAANISKEVGDHWLRLARKLLACAEYETTPFALRWDSLSVEFGEELPAGSWSLYADPTVDLAIAEDSMRYESAAEKMARKRAALGDLGAVAAEYPGLLDKLVSEYLEATGMRDASGFLEQAKQTYQQMMQSAGPQMSVGLGSETPMS